MTGITAIAYAQVSNADLDTEFFVIVIDGEVQPDVYPTYTAAETALAAHYAAVANL